MDHDTRQDLGCHQHQRVASHCAAQPFWALGRAQMTKLVALDSVLVFLKWLDGEVEVWWKKRRREV